MTHKSVTIETDGVHIVASAGDKVTLIREGDDTETFLIEGVTDTGLVRTRDRTFGKASFVDRIRQADMVQVNKAVDEE